MQVDGRKAVITLGNKKIDKERTFTKKLVMVMLVVGVINSEIPYLLALAGRDPVVDIGRLWITQIIAVIVGYYIKSYFGKKEEENVRLKETYLYNNGDDESSSSDDDEDYYEEFDFGDSATEAKG